MSAGETAKPEFVLRRAEGEDIEPLVPLARETFVDGWAQVIGADTAQEYAETTFTPEFFGAQIANAAQTFFVAVRCADKTIAGYAVVEPSRKMPDCVTLARGANLHRLYIAAPFRGLGLADRVLLACEKEAEAAGCDGLWLESDPRNGRAWRFYEKRGFAEVGTGIYRFNGRIINPDERILQRPLMTLAEPE